jgi:multidrug transporter EmrE-like cation transporter
VNGDGAKAMSVWTFLIILLGVLLNATAQLSLKAGTNAIGVINVVPGRTLSLLGTLAVQPWILVGLACYVVSVAAWIVALSRVNVSVAYPMLSIGYVVNAIAARYLLGEVLTFTRLLGMAVIICGVFIISRD